MAEMQIGLKKVKSVALFSAEQFALRAFGIWGPVFQGVFFNSGKSPVGDVGMCGLFFLTFPAGISFSHLSD